MGTRWVRPLVAATLVVLGACSERSDDEGATPTTEDAPSTTSADTTAPPTTEAPRKTSTTRAPRSTTTASTSTTTTPPTTAPPSTAAPAAAALPVAVPGCVVEVAAGDTLELIVTSLGTVDVAGVQAENALADPNVINVGAYLDVCVGNDVDDITGASRTPPAAPAAPAEPAAPIAPETTLPPPPPVGYGVAAQQQKLNELFYGLGFSGLTVDGDSGRFTEQALCAARLSLGLPASRADMEPGGAEEAALMAATSLSMPLGAPTGYGRWVLIDRTCQVLFVGEGADRLVYVFPTSTGEPGYGTRTQDASPVFRYDPATGNNGWHNSYDYPVGGDNPLNGNMYKPLYFDGGQAIHGANNVPPWPRSKGCARLRVGDQQQLVDWVGLGEQRSQLYNAADQIGLVVTVQGDF